MKTLAITTTTNTMQSKQNGLTPPRLAPMACIIALLFASAPSAVWAQRYQPLHQAPVNANSALAPTALPQVGAVDYSANASIARVLVEIEKDGIPADGQSSNTITVKLFGKDDKPLSGTAIITIENTGGRILLNGARTDELGPGAQDLDKVTPGIQLRVTDGVASFKLLAPTKPTDVRLRITAGAAVAEGTVSYLPELRDMVAAGLIEGIIQWRNKGQNPISPITGIGDGFERELSRWTRVFNAGRGTVGTRTAFFVVGKIKGDMLLTAAFDSDKDTKAQLLKDVDPNRFYPVYGDASLTDFAARSRDRLFLRIDSGKNYALYGDFATGDGFSVPSGAGIVASVKNRSLGAYNRTATGLRGHFEQPNYFVNGFATYDSLKQLVEEYRANGTSGPFSVSNTGGVQGSEKIEIITRDKNALDRVVAIVAQVPLIDYTFEPFSGRVLFKSPIASQDANGNPQSIRISYEVDQGGSRFGTAGVDGQVRLGDRVELGASVVRDQNPLSPYALNSANISLAINPQSKVVLEYANSRSSQYVSGASSLSSVLSSTPTGSVGEARSDQRGNAWRLEGNYDHGAFTSKLWLIKADKNFVNPAASVGRGAQEFGVLGRFALTEALAVYGGLNRSVDASQVTEPRRDLASLGVTWNVNASLVVDASVRRAKEDAGFVAQSGLASNATPGGGFFGNGQSVTNPGTDTAVALLGASNTAASGSASAALANATSFRLSASYKITERWSAMGEVETGGDRQSRFSAGTGYQINERSRAYARYERTTGLTSSGSLNPSDRSNSFIAGIDNTFAAGPSLFTELRLRDAVSGATALARDQALATGLRNTWNVSEGLAYTGGIEQLKILSGKQRDAFSIYGGVDFSQSERWKLSSRLEFRRLSDDSSTTAKDTADQYLSTVSFARKLDRDWTLLARNYLLYQDNHANGTRLEDRFQIGAAWRPVDHNRWNTLGRYEYRTVEDKTALLNSGNTAAGNTVGEKYTAHIISLHSDYHPSRPWWINGRIAAKSVTNKNLPVGQQGYAAYLVGARAVYDVTENWDVALMSSYLYSPTGKSKQWAQGVEAGYLVRQNLWLSVGFNWKGFNDKELSGNDYTNRGAYLRLRFKFDEALLQGSNKESNRSLDRN